MATLKEIKGTDIEVRTSDPANPEVGQVWYNTTTELLKGYKQVVGNAWSTGWNLNTARNTLAGVGTVPAALAFGGDPNAQTESWNGTSWTEVNDLNTATAYAGGVGVQTSALAAGGLTAPGARVAKTEEWNGTNWSNVNDLNTARRGAVGSGTTSAGLAFGGESPPPTAATEEWNGTGQITRTITSTTE